MKYDDDLDPPEREVTLGTAAILGIFLVLALVCGAFFGFGYSMGRRSAPQSTAAAEPKSDSKSADFSEFKSAPDSDNTSDTAADTSKAAAPAPPAEKAAPTPKQDEPQVVVHQPTPAPAAKPAETPHPTFPIPASAQPAAAAPAPGAPQIMVQISATSRQGDADALIAALKRKGYNAAIHHQPDNLYHVQLGPFASKKDADALRKKLGDDGYNAILK